MFLRKVEAAEKRKGPRQITLEVASKPHPLRLIGVGAEDDGWAYTKGNLSHGWGPKELDLRESRIRWMQPDYIRMFFWIGEWLPFGYFAAADVSEAYRWDTDLMKSKYRSLELYKELGAPVQVTCVEWTMDRFGSPWTKPERVVKGYADLVEHLVKEKGFDNIDDFTLSNEPNIWASLHPISTSSFLPSTRTSRHGSSRSGCRY